MDRPLKSGVVIEPVSKEDWLFGISAIDNSIKCPDGNWTPYLPTNEKQRQGFESMCCTNFSSTSAVEILLTRLIRLKMVSGSNLKWLSDNNYIDSNGSINFSDRFDAIVSNTNPEWGNSLKAVADAKHKFGLIPESMLPWTDNSTEYFDKNSITQEMRDMGYEFLTRFKINYETVYEKDYQIALKISPLAIAVYAWDGIENGVYKRVENQINHAVTLIKPPTYWNIMDSYDPFVKKLANNYKYLGYAYRYIVTELDAENAMNDIIVDKELRDELYDLILHRKPDADADTHIGRSLAAVLTSFRGSGEWSFWDGVIRFFKSLKPAFLKYGTKK